jgi:hypothetical protein
MGSFTDPTVIGNRESRIEVNLMLSVRIFNAKLDSPRTQASKTGSSTPPFSVVVRSSAYVVMVLKLLSLVVVSALRSPLKATIRLGSEIEERSGTSARYESLLAVEELPKAPNPEPAAEAARLLDAAVLNWFLLIVNEGLVAE